MTTRRANTAALVAAVAVTAALFIDLCDAIFGCGCRSIFGGAAEACSHMLGQSPGCPWCAHRIAGGSVAFAGIVAAQAAAIFAPRSLALRWRLALALAAFPVVGTAIGLLHGWYWGHWG